MQFPHAQMALACDAAEMDWGVLAAIGGGAAAFAGGVLADIVRSRLNIGEARTEREAARAAFKEDRRVAFELETLLGLQTSVQVMARRVGKSHHLDKVHYAATREWGTEQLPAEVGGDESLAVGQEFIRLRSRVPDQELRVLLNAFNQTITSHALTPVLEGVSDVEKRARAESLLTEMTEQLEEIQERIGQRLQLLYS